MHHPSITHHPQLLVYQAAYPRYIKGPFTLGGTFPFPRAPACDQPPLPMELMGEQKRDLIKSGAPRGWGELHC